MLYRDVLIPPIARMDSVAPQTPIVARAASLGLVHAQDLAL